MTAIKADQFTKLSMGENYAGAVFHFRTSAGEEVAIEVPAEDLMQLIEASSLALSSIGQHSTDGIQHADVSGGNVRLPAGPDIVAIELAFGQNGHLYLGFPTPVAKRLHEKLSKAFEEIDAMPKQSH